MWHNDILQTWIRLLSIYLPVVSFFPAVDENRKSYSWWKIVRLTHEIDILWALCSRRRPTQNRSYVAAFAVVRCEAHFGLLGWRRYQSGRGWKTRSRVSSPNLNYVIISLVCIGGSRSRQWGIFPLPNSKNLPPRPKKKHSQKLTLTLNILSSQENEILPRPSRWICRSAIIGLLSIMNSARIFCFSCVGDTDYKIQIRGSV